MSSGVSEASLQIRPALAAIREAERFLAGYFGATRLVAAPYLSERVGRRVWLKLEAELPTGSFKVRGASWGLASRWKRSPVAEGVASSVGNDGAAVAWAAKLLGLKARICLAVGSNPVKRRRNDSLGAEIVE